MSCSIGGGGSGSVVSSLLDVSQMGQVTPRAYLGDVSFSSLLQGAADSSIQDKDTQS